MTTSYDVNDEGWVTGGWTTGVGLDIRWQDGPLVDGKANGATLEDVIGACMDRLDVFQNNARSKNLYNAQALQYLENALSILNARTQDRKLRGVEGKYEA